MKKTSRYILYFVIGIALYYILKKEGNEGVLTEVHEYAPALILTVFVLLLVVRGIVQKKRKGDDA